MKFLLIVLTVHFIGELINNRVKAGKLMNEEEGEKNEFVRHPAEFILR